MCRCLQTLQQGFRSPGAGIPGGYMHLMWEQSVVPMEKQHMLSAAAPSLQTQIVYLIYRKVWNTVKTDTHASTIHDQRLL